MTKLEFLFCVTVLLVSLLSAVWTFYTKYRLRKTMEHMAQMIDAATMGTFCEDVYDESLLSFIETKLAHYLAASKNSAQQVSNEKENIKKLIADISHQTKTPIANILLYSQLLCEKDLPKESRTCIEALNQQAEKLNFLIHSLVKLSRLETGVLVLHPEIRPISPMLKEVIAQISPKATKKGIRLEFEASNLYACFDSKWTAEAIYNIMDNAVKYTPAGGNVSVALLHTELFARIAIRDSGIGISEEETTKIFGRFYRSPRVRDSEGVGIGLFLTREIIAKESGYIKVTSEPGNGSTFFVYLPAAQP